MLGSDLRLGEVKVVIDHFEGRVAQDFAKREDIPSVHQVVRGKRVAAEMCMQPRHARCLGQSGSISTYHIVRWQKR